MSNASKSTLVVVGGGNMGAALVEGLLAASTVDTSRLSIVEVIEARRQQLRIMFPAVNVTSDIPECEAAVIAVKPVDVPAVVARAVACGATRVLSIAAGVTIATLEAAAGDHVAVVRAMPNTPAMVRQGASAISAGTRASEVDMEWAGSILGAVGTVVRVAETHLDAVTGLAGSGPAYLFLVAEALIDAGVAAGLSRDVADALVRQLLTGSAALLAGGEQPADLRARVTSPGGTTAAGIAVLEGHAVRTAFIDAVRAATERGRELGRS